MAVIFVVLARPWTHPGELEFLAAYATRSAAERFVQAQLDDARDCLVVREVEVDRHPDSDGFWKNPSDGV